MMKTLHKAGGIALLVVTLALVSGCEATRGKFTGASCDSGARVAVDSSAVYAIYVDASGKSIGDFAEELKGTAENKMCPTPALSGPGGCKTGYCPTAVNGKTYCLRC